MTRWPDLIEAIDARTTRVFLAVAHLNHQPETRRMRSLRALCQRCHLNHDRPYHLAQRWITYRARYAIGDLFLGPYQYGAVARQWRSRGMFSSPFTACLQRRHRSWAWCKLP